MRNHLEISSVAQSLDGVPSDGEPAFPRIINLTMPGASGNLSGTTLVVPAHLSAGMVSAAVNEIVGNDLKRLKIRIS